MHQFHSDLVDHMPLPVSKLIAMEIPLEQFTRVQGMYTAAAQPPLFLESLGNALHERAMELLAQNIESVLHGMDLTSLAGFDHQPGT